MLRHLTAARRVVAGTGAFAVLALVLCVAGDRIETDYDRLIHRLLAQLQDGELPLMRAQAALYLARYPDLRAVGPLIARLRDESPEVRGEAASALGDIAMAQRAAGMSDPRLIEALRSVLRDRSSSVRYKAVRALGHTRSRDAVESLVGALKDENWEVRDSAVDGLWYIRDPRAVRPLLEAALAGVVTPKLMSALQDLTAGASTDHLIATLDDAEPAQRQAGARALAASRDPRAEEALVVALGTRRLEIVAAAYRVFIRRGQPGTEAVLIEALNRYGDVEMAASFVDCGNERLEMGARAWASTRGIDICRGPASTAVIWGRVGVPGYRVLGPPTDVPPAFAPRCR